MVSLGLNYGLSEMCYECGRTSEGILVTSPELQRLSLFEFCTLTREEILLSNGMTPEKLLAIEQLLAEYSLRIGMPIAELKAYEDQYFKERPQEKDFYDLCDKMGEIPNGTHQNQEEKPVFDEKAFREHLCRELHSNPLGNSRLSDLGWQRYQTVREAYLSQPFYVRWFGSYKTRMLRAVRTAFWVHEIFCQLVIEDSVKTEKWYVENRKTIR